MDPDHRWQSPSRATSQVRSITSSLQCSQRKAHNAAVLDEAWALAQDISVLLNDLDPDDTPSQKTDLS
jgi:hypothetical protein